MQWIHVICAVVVSLTVRMSLSFLSLLVTFVMRINECHTSGKLFVISQSRKWCQNQFCFPLFTWEIVIDNLLWVALYQFA